MRYVLKLNAIELSLRCGSDMALQLMGYAWYVAQVCCGDVFEIHLRCVWDAFEMRLRCVWDEFEMGMWLKWFLISNVLLCGLGMEVNP